MGYSDLHRMSVDESYISFKRDGKMIFAEQVVAALEEASTPSGKQHKLTFEYFIDGIIFAGGGSDDGYVLTGQDEATVAVTSVEKISDTEYRLTCEPIDGVEPTTFTVTATVKGKRVEVDMKALPVE